MDYDGYSLDAFLDALGQQLGRLLRFAAGLSSFFLLPLPQTTQLLPLSF